MEAEERRKWHVDKTVPIALLFMLLMQTVGIVWWAAKIDSRVEVIEGTHSANARLSERVVRLEVVLDRLDKTLDRINKRWK